MIFIGAAARIRTGTPFRTQDFESCLSANSNTRRLSLRRQDVKQSRHSFSGNSRSATNLADRFGAVTTAVVLFPMITGIQDMRSVTHVMVPMPKFFELSFAFSVGFFHFFSYFHIISSFYKATFFYDFLHELPLPNARG